jgi:hypothetical protein
VRIAVCISGQLRNWDQCGAWWEPLFSHLAPTYDVFVHTWDYRTEPGSTVSAPVSDIELTAFRDCFDPVAMQVSPAADYAWLDERAARIPDTCHLVTPGRPSTQHASQFDSMRRAFHLKREHEIAEGFLYDIVIRARTDIRITKPQPLAAPGRDTVMGELFRRLAWRHTHFSDRFFISDSVTADKIGNVFAALPMIRSGVFFEPDKDITPETVLHFYLRMLGLKIQSIDVATRLVRSSQYAAAQCELGRGLGAHETI